MPPADGTAPVQVVRTQGMNASQSQPLSDAGPVARAAPPLSHFLALERQADDTREAISRRELERSSGVSWSGMGSEPFTRRSEAQLRRDAIERRQALMEHRAGRASSNFRSFP